MNLAPEGYDEQVFLTPEEELAVFLQEQEEADMLEMYDDEECDWQAEQRAAYNSGMGD